MNRTNKYIAVLLLAVASGVSGAASIDCANAKTKVEKLVCTDSELSQLDEQLSTAYRRAKLVKKTSRDSVTEWQETWRDFTRDNCSDVVCLKKVYISHVAELHEYAEVASEGATISGTYERYFRERPDKHSATLHIFELQNNRVRVVGSAIWVGNADIGNVHTGEINGVFTLDGNKLHYSDFEANSCHLTITFTHGTLVVSDDNLRCGGLNVSFDGEYRHMR